MKNSSTAIYRRFVSIADSNRFFWFVVGLLIFQALWIALSGLYPMAFDENFHFGLIQLYGNHVSPFWGSQPESANAFGAITRDPSYLYHYIFSFPYRFIALFTDSQTTQVIILRLLNIGLFASGLVLYRRLLLKTGAHKGIVHFSLLVFVLLPIVPLLAAQINYDNVFLPLTALALLLVVKLDSSIYKDKKFDITTLMQLLIVCLASSLIKYAFLPIFVAIVGFLVIRTWLYYRSFGKLWSGFAAGWARLIGWSRVGLIVGFVIVAGLFVERYGVNLVRYHTPVPDCSAVLTVEQCSEYGPWIRDHDLKLNKSDNASRSPVTFTHEWFYGMWLRTFFAVDGPTTGFQTRGPLLVPGLAAIIFAVVSGLALLLTLPRLLRRYSAPVLWLFIAVTIIFIGLLWLDEFEAFVRTGKPVAINGRYLLPVMPLLLFSGAAAWNELFGRLKVLKMVFASVVVLSMLWGGGVLTYVLRSNDNWYWPNSNVIEVNQNVRDSIGPLVPGYDQQTQFLH